MSVDQLMQKSILEFVVYSFHGKVVWFTLLYAGVLTFLEVFKRPFARFRIQKKYPSFRTMVREYLLCLSSFVFFMPWYILTLYFYRHGYYHMYSPWDKYGVAYFVFSIVLVIFLHETYHYFYHRFMHTNKFMMRRVHRVHHTFPNPTALTSYAFHPIEALFHPLIFPFIPLVLPVNIYAALIFLAISEAVNIIGHHGYEWFGETFEKNRFLRILNRSTFHNLHHSNGGRTNFGYYTILWDRWLGTENKLNETRFKDLKEKARKAA